MYSSQQIEEAWRKFHTPVLLDAMKGRRTYIFTRHVESLIRYVVLRENRCMRNWWKVWGFKTWHVSEGYDSTMQMPCLDVREDRVMGSVIIVCLHRWDCRGSGGRVHQNRCTVNEKSSGAGGSAGQAGLHHWNTVGLYSVVSVWNIKFPG